jgi:molybdenum cofactor cytidylyltransferase
MGNRNKLLLPYKGTTVLAYTVGNILTAGLQDVIVVTGFESGRVLQALGHLPLRFVHNPLYDEGGMSGSIREAVRVAGGTGYMICLADMALIRPEEYAALANAFNSQVALNERCICLPDYRGEKGNPVLFSSFYKEAILQHAEKEGCKGIVRSFPENIHLVNMASDHILRDIDYPEDYNSLSL